MRQNHTGVPILDHLNGALWVKQHKGDLPFLFIMNGRQDGSVPWENNPPFYKALNEARQGYTVYWDNGGHSMPDRQRLPEDIQTWLDGKRVQELALNRSFPAFSHCSTDKNPGHGDPAEGDIVGWINRGLAWKDIEDAPDHFAISIGAAFPGIVYPVRVDITPRRVQQFKVKPGETVRARIGRSEAAPITADAEGLITLRGIVIPSSDDVRIVISR